MKFSDHFSKTARSYREHRPLYPELLFPFLASSVTGHRLAWDCATGNGQAAASLAAYFDHVVATDGSQKQIDNAIVHPKVEYRVALAEQSGLKEHSVDLITVAQALHWFRFEDFYAEVRRVAAPGAVIAVWVYDLMTCGNKTIDDIVHDFYWNVLVAGNYWPPERTHIEARYATIPFPFDTIQAPHFRMKGYWTLQGFMDYLGTWSAVQNYKERNGRDPIEELLRDRLRAAWRNPEEQVEFHTELALKVGRVVVQP
jgi:SAM-dependent methyltransferase